MADRLIFVVDDEPGVADFVSEIVADFGQVRSFTNPQEALDELKNHRPDLLITDQRMPQMSGLDLIEAADKVYPGQKSILISGDLDFSKNATQVISDKIPYFSKPLADLDEFEEAVARLLGD